MSYDLNPNVNAQRTLILGTGWRGGAEVFRMGWSFLVILFLATLLSPKDFGLVGMTDVFVQFFNIFMSLGFDNAIIQQKNINQRILSSLFWLNLLVGGVLTFISVLLSPVLAWFYQEPLVEPVFAVLSLTFFLQSLSVVQRGLLGRQLAFRELAIVDVVATLFASLLALWVAAQGGTYWSLVAMQLVKHALTAIGYWINSRWRPTWEFDVRASWQSIRFSGNLLLFNLLNFAATRSDMLLIGRLLGPEQLGFYFLAQRLILQPIAQILLVVERTLYPVLANLQDNPAQVRQLFIQTIYVLFTALSPLILLAILLAPLLIPYLLGEQWTPLVPIFIVWCFSAGQRLLTSRVGVINLAMGRPDLQWKFQLISTPLVIASLFVGIGYGALGVSLSYALAQFFMSFLSLSLAFPLVDLSIVRYFQHFGWVFFCLGVCGLVGWGLQNLLLGVDWSPYLTTAVFSTIILLLFGLGLYTLDKQMRSIVQTSGHWLQQRYRATHVSHLS